MNRFAHIPTGEGPADWGADLVQEGQGLLGEHTRDSQWGARRLLLHLHSRCAGLARVPHALAQVTEEALGGIRYVLSLIHI